MSRSLGICLALLVACGAPTPAEARRYTLAELLEKVGNEYLGVVAARHAQDASQAQLEQAGRLWAPTGEITFGLTGSPDIKCQDALGQVDPDKAVRQRNCVATTSTDLRTNAGILQILPVNGVALNLSARLVQPLYTSGKIESARALA
jgi:hypothetical protein